MNEILRDEVSASTASSSILITIFTGAQTWRMLILMVLGFLHIAARAAAPSKDRNGVVILSLKNRFIKRETVLWIDSPSHEAVPQA